MALPTTILSDVGLPGYHPPYISSVGDVYSVIRADADELDVKKATDPEDSWTLKDAASGPVHVGTLLGYATYQDGDIIHIVAWSSATYEYYTFNMATDAWVIDELLITPSDAPTQPWASIAVRSGVPVVPYAGDTDRIMGGKKERVDVAHRDGGTWTVGIALDAGGDDHYGNPNVVKGLLTDDMHILWGKQTIPEPDPPVHWGDYEGRTLDSTNNLSTLDTGLGGGPESLLGAPHLVFYDDSGTQRISSNFANTGIGNSFKSILASEDGSDNIQIDSEPTEDISGTAHMYHSNSPNLEPQSFAEFNGDLHLLYSGGGGASGPDQDLWYITSTDNGNSWSTPTEEINSTTVNFISATIYVRDINTVMAIVYDDGGVQKYYEKVLIAGQTHQMML